MSFEPDNPTHQSELEALLEQILCELQLLNARLEEVHETNIEKEDIE